MQTTIHWFRNDLRLSDNPALSHAAGQGAVVPVYIWNPKEHGSWQPGAASQWWLHQSLASLAKSLEKIGSRLILQQGDPLTALKQLADTAKADAVVWNRRYEPQLIESDKRVKRGLAEADIDAQSFNGALLYEPWQVETKQGKPYQVFSPFHRTVQAMPEPSKPLDAPKSLKSPAKWPKSDKLDDLKLMPTIKWYQGMAQAWDVSEQGAQDALAQFVDDPIGDYLDARDIPRKHGTSRMSPYLHTGEISPRQAYHAAAKRTRGTSGGSDKLKKNAYGYIRELVWREFGYHLIYHFPHTPDNPLREKYEAFPWVDHTSEPAKVALAAWKSGQTGYPIVDAGMRQLWHTGWMHNRVRMVVASFLVKHLLINWHEGAKWFWDTLVDADLANNTLGWQWAGGCGADAAPYFRIFNPMTQGEKFDTDGEYVRKWCPELKDVPKKYIHKPWECPPLELQAAGVTLGEDYPEPIVDHKKARERALEALSEVTG
jgi:deoxyribodipyrimidine photo-lyase